VCSGCRHVWSCGQRCTEKGGSETRSLRPAFTLPSKGELKEKRPEASQMDIYGYKKDKKKKRNLGYTLL